MKVKTSGLSGAALDWAVATCQNLPIKRDPMGLGDGSWWVFPDDFPPSPPGYRRIGGTYSPSTNCMLSWPIIDGKRISTWWDYETQSWRAASEKWMTVRIESDAFFDMPEPTAGQTALIAAMRCHVQTELGDEVDVPEELA